MHGLSAPPPPRSDGAARRRAARAVHRRDVLRDPRQVRRPVGRVAEDDARAARRDRRRRRAPARARPDRRAAPSRSPSPASSIGAMAVRATRPGRLTAQDLALEAAEAPRPARCRARRRSGRARPCRPRAPPPERPPRCRAVHQLAPEALAQPMLDDERVELADDVRVVAELDIGGDALLERDEAQLLQPPVSVWAQSSNANSASAGPRHSSSARTSSVASLLGRRTSRVREQRVRSDARRAARGSIRSAYPGGRVTSTSGPSAFRSATIAFWTDVRRRFRRRSPHSSSSISRSVGTTRPALSSRSDEQRALPRPPESDRRLLVPHLERAEDPEAKHRCGGCSTPHVPRH